MKHRNPITTTPGFRSSGITCGIKQSGTPDVSLIAAEDSCVAAAVYTTNRVKAPALVLNQANLKSQLARAIVTISGNANTCVGPRGTKDAKEIAALTANGLGITAREVAVCCTGVIGVPLPMDKVRQGIPQAIDALGIDPQAETARAILTTDTDVKLCKRTVRVGGRVVHVGGIAKGSGMIHPDMATMLAYISTDVAIAPKLLQQALEQAVNVSFNSITVDGDQSTSDSVIALANGRAGHAPITKQRSTGYAAFLGTLTTVCVDLAKQIARDGEGASKLIVVTLKGASSTESGRTLARAVAKSNLVKAAAFGNDPNWGRIMAALGSTGLAFNPGKTDIWINGVQVTKGGAAANFDEKRVAAAMKKDELRFVIDLHAGRHTWEAYSCDLTYDYVKINAEYTT